MKKIIFIIIVFICLITYCSSPGQEDKIEVTNESFLENDSKNTKYFYQKDSTNQQITGINKKTSNKKEVTPKLTNKTYYVVKGVGSFKKRFNQFSRASSSSLRIGNITINQGKVNNTFQYMFNKYIGILGTVNKVDNSLKELTMIGQSDGSLSSGIDIIVVMGGIINSVQPNLNPNERGQILKDLGILGDEIDLMNLEENTHRGNIKYWVNSSKYIGIMFGASHINNN